MFLSSGRAWPIIVRLIVVGLVCSNSSVPQAQQIVSSQKAATLRNRLPDVDQGLPWREVFDDPDLLFYTTSEMPRAYQHADVGLVVGGSIGRSHASTFYWVGYNISNDPTDRNKPDGQGGNVGVDFPWRVGFGLDFCEHSTRKFFFMQRAKRPNGGGYWPVVWWRQRMTDSQQGPHLVYRWLFPKGTVFGEVLQLRDSKDRWHTFQVRLRIRASDYWDVEVLQPFPESSDLEQALGKTFKYRPVVRMVADSHERRHFQLTSGVVNVPAMSEAAAMKLLDETPFKSSVGRAWLEQDGITVFQPTSDRTSIVPAKYQGFVGGNTHETCAKCHRDTLKHADVISPDRGWYGRCPGSDDILSWHPIAPSSVSTSGASRQVHFRREFVESGLIEQFDPARHPATVYRRIRR